MIAIGLEKIKNIGLSYALSLSFRSENPSIWLDVLNRTKYVPVMYTGESIEFQLAYQKGHGGVWNDLSMIIDWDGKPSAVWPLSLSIKDNLPVLSSHGLPVHPPLFVSDCPASSQKRIIKSCLDFANSIALNAGIAQWESTESFNDVMGFSDWHIESMTRGAFCSIAHDLFIDLHRGMAEIKKGFRKSYKSLVTSGMKHWVVNVLDTNDEFIWKKFQQLHYKVSGRKTRSDDTWAIHLEDIAQQRGFLVYLLGSTGEMEGAGFFNFTKHEGLYAVAAYNRELFDKPLGHIVQYRAIEELKKRDVSWYKLGVRPFPSEKPVPTEKEISIGEFKQGFASHMLPRYCLYHVVSRSEKSPEMGVFS